MAIINTWQLWLPAQHLHSKETGKVEEELTGSAEVTVEYVMETGVNRIVAQYKNENKRNLAFMAMLELIGSFLMTYLSNQHLGV